MTKQAPMAKILVLMFCLQMNLAVLLTGHHWSYLYKEGFKQRSSFKGGARRERRRGPSSAKAGHSFFVNHGVATSHH